MRLARPLVATGVGLALADASVVTLALPELIVELDTTIEGVAAVLGVYAVVLAAALIPAERLRRQARLPAPWRRGFIVFAAAGLGCGLAGSLAALLLLPRAPGAWRGRRTRPRLRLPDRRRARPGAPLDRRRRARCRRRAGPGRGSHGAVRLARDLPRPGPRGRALRGGVSGFPGQAGGAGIATAGPRRGAEPAEHRERIELGPTIALALVSAALSAVLFLLVLLLVSGWSVSPLEAALVVAIVPVAALIGMRFRGDPRLRAIAGCALVGAGVLALAFFRRHRSHGRCSRRFWPGLGMGLALTSLVGPLLYEGDPTPRLPPCSRFATAGSRWRSCCWRRSPQRRSTAP